MGVTPARHNRISRFIFKITKERNTTDFFSLFRTVGPIVKIIGHEAADLICTYVKMYFPAGPVEHTGIDLNALTRNTSYEMSY